MFFHRFSLNFALKAPIYDTNEEASKESPIIDLIFSFKNFTFNVQRLFSPARPFTKFSAALSLARHLAASYSTSCFLVSASSNCLFKALTLAFKSATFALTIYNSFFFYSRVSFAYYSDSYKGLTYLNILLKITIFIAQAANLDAAND